MSDSVNDASAVADSAQHFAGIPARLNTALAAGFLGLGLFQYFLLPLVLLRVSPWWALALVPCALSTTANWALIHEAIHSVLMENRRANDAWGRALAVFFVGPLEVLRFAHLHHHRINGSPADRPEFFAEAEMSRLAASLIYYPRLLLGTFAAEFAGTFICLAPQRVIERAVQEFPREGGGDVRARSYLLQSGRLVRLRLDAAVTLALLAFAFWSYGAFWWLLALSLLARAVLVSVADNSYHYGAPLAAGAYSALNFRLPLSGGILHFNLHRVHHRHPSLSWNALPGAFRAANERYDAPFLAAMLRQFRGPVSDLEYRRGRP
jgi:fatty acid desaturase